jgi:hypothetical protein
MAESQSQLKLNSSILQINNSNQNIKSYGINSHFHQYNNSSRRNLQTTSLVTKDGLDIICYFAHYCWRLDSPVSSNNPIPNYEHNDGYCQGQRVKFGDYGFLSHKYENTPDYASKPKWLDAKSICQNTHPNPELAGQPYDPSLLCSYPPRNVVKDYGDKLYCDDDDGDGTSFAPNLVLEITDESSNYEYNAVQGHVTEWQDPNDRQPYESTQNDVYNKLEFGIATIPVNMGDLVALKKFVFFNKLGKLGLAGNLPDSISKLEGLKHLEIRGNKGQRFKYVDIYNLSLGVIPEHQFKPISYVPDRFNELVDLAFLRDKSTLVLAKPVKYCYGAGLTGSIPDSISKLNGLTQLNLADNQFEEIHEDAFHRSGLSLLKVLDLTGNNLKSLPRTLGDLPNLTKFGIVREKSTKNIFVNKKNYGSNDFTR